MNGSATHRCAGASPWPDAPCRLARPSTEKAKRRVSFLKKLIRWSIGKTSPHAKSNPGPSGKFAGAWDWHSAVHGHWTLLCMARLTNDRKLEEALLGRLTAESLDKEQRFLAKTAKSEFEQPYGRAWLLLMTDEFMRRRPGPGITRVQRDAARKLREFLEDDLLAWLERSDYPERPRIVATHRSWLFAYWLLTLSRPKRQSVLRRMKPLARKTMKGRDTALRHRPAPNDFLHLPAVQALVERTDLNLSRRPKSYPLDVPLALDTPPLTKRNAHLPGAALVQVWPYAIESHGGNQNACARFHTRLNEVFARSDQWRDCFEHVSHWVPQFMWMAIWLGMGRP